MRRTLAFSMLLVALSACSMVNGKSEQNKETEKTSTQPGVSSNPGVPAKEIIRFKTFSYIDKQGIGIEAFRMLIPSDWQFEGEIKWVLDNPGMSAVAGFRVRNTRGMEEFEVFPNQPFFWTNNRMILSMFPKGIAEIFRREDIFYA
ncbi:MAG: hypothetical protein QME81_18005 [bacterium]|nr:hypothetical protein [bacterium]